MKSVLMRLLGGATAGFDIDVSALLTSAPYGFFLTVDGPADLPAHPEQIEEAQITIKSAWRMSSPQVGNPITYTNPESSPSRCTFAGHPPADFQPSLGRRRSYRQDPGDTTPRPAPATWVVERPCWPKASDAFSGSAHASVPIYCLLGVT